MTSPAPLFQSSDLVTWREAFTGRECRGVVRESREMREMTNASVQGSRFRNQRRSVRSLGQAGSRHLFHLIIDI